MFKAAVAAARVARPATRSAFSPTILRSFSSTTRISSDGHGPPPPQLFGPGAKPGTIPSDIEQSTGLERLQLLGELEGVTVFDDSPLDSSRIGTKANPILVPSLDVERIIGCTGSPADSHNLRWYNLKLEKQTRCGECGSVYALDYQGAPLGEHEHTHAHH